MKRVYIFIIVLCVVRITYCQSNHFVLDEFDFLNKHYSNKLLVDSVLCKALNFNISTSKLNMIGLKVNKPGLIQNSVFDYKIKHIEIHIEVNYKYQDLRNAIRNNEDIIKIYNDGYYNYFGFNVDKVNNKIDMIFAKRYISINEILGVKEHQFVFLDGTEVPEPVVSYFALIRGEILVKDSIYYEVKDSIYRINCKKGITKNLIRNSNNFEIRVPLESNPRLINFFNSRLDTIAIIDPDAITNLKSFRNEKIK